VLDPVVDAASLQRVVDVPGTVRRDHHDRGHARPERPELRHRDREVGEHLEEERLELVVGPVDLVDEENRRRPGPGSDRHEERPADEEALGVELVFEGGPLGAALHLGRPEVEQLAGVVPLVDRLSDVDALVALQPEQPPARDGREGLRHLGLAHAGLALEEERPGEGDRQERGRGEALVGEVPGGDEPLGELLRACGRPAPDRRRARALRTAIGGRHRLQRLASSSARRTSTVARCRR
jgi:hypothetical protein